jgi:hypothetical protein
MIHIADMANSIFPKGPLVSSSKEGVRKIGWYK